jgi:hypothetical protein
MSSTGDRSWRVPITQAGRAVATVVAVLGLILPAIAQTEDKPAPAENASETTAAPKLALSSTEWDFGTKWSGEKAETTLTLTNVGNAVLKVASVKGSCGCTVPKLKKSTIEPGESVELTISYNTKKRTTNVKQTIRVTSNDPDNPVQTVSVTGKVKQMLVMKPTSSVRFRDLTHDSKKQQIIDIECNYTEPINLKLKDEPSEFFEKRLETVEEGRHYKLIVDTKPPLRDGSMTANAKLETGVDLMPEAAVRIIGIVQPRLSLAPARVNLPAQSKEPTERTLRLTYRGEKPPTITSVSCDFPGIKVEAVPSSSDQRQAPRRLPPGIVFRVSLPPSSELPEGGATITVNTDDPEYSEFKVPVVVMDYRAARRSLGSTGTSGRKTHPKAIEVKKGTTGQTP